MTVEGAMIAEAPEIVRAYHSIIGKYGSRSCQADEAAAFLAGRKESLSYEEILNLLRKIYETGSASASPVSFPPNDDGA